MNSDSPLSYQLALWRTHRVGPITFSKLVNLFPNLEELFKLPATQLLKLKLPAPIIESIQAPDWKGVERDLHWAGSKKHHHIITYQDASYPEQLKNIPSAPPILFIAGNLEALTSPQLAMVGSRSPTVVGKETAQAFALQLSQAGLTITSGLALGIDGAAHQGAIDAGGKTIAVLGSGIDCIYPKRHKCLAENILATKGAIVSELGTGASPEAKYFPRRNRIVSGLSLGVLVVEATLHSGSLITAHLAAEQGREVFSMPGSIHNPLSRGCHLLIREGAKLVETAQDILEELPKGGATHKVGSPQKPASGPHIPKKPLDADYQQLLECIGFEATNIDQLCQRTGLAPHTVASMVFILELEGYVASSSCGIHKI